MVDLDDILKIATIVKIIATVAPVIEKLARYINSLVTNKRPTVRSLAALNG